MESIGLPSYVRVGLSKFVCLSDKDFRGLQNALATAPLHIRRRHFAASVASAAATDEKADIEEIIPALMYLFSYSKSQTDPDQFADDLISELRVQAPGELGIEPDKAGQLKERLFSVFQIDTLRLRSKASDLIFEDAQVYQASRVITDIRPVFGGADGFEIRGGLIVHSLKIQFYTAAGANEIYISLDDDDIIELKRVIERAQRKADVLRSHLKTSKIADLNPGESSDNA